MGFSKHFRDFSFKCNNRSLQRFLQREITPEEYAQFQKKAEAQEPIFLNKIGNPEEEGVPVEEKESAYKAILLDCTLQDQPVYAFAKHTISPHFPWQFVCWDTLTHFHQTLVKTPHLEAPDNFYKDLADKALPEAWSFKGLKEPYCILKSYIQHMLGKLQDEEKLLVSYTKVAFHTRLINRLTKDPIIIVAERTKYPKIFTNPVIIRDENMLKKYLFRKLPQTSWKQRQNGSAHADSLFIEKFDDIEPAVFFNDLEDILFHADWPIPTDEKFISHISKRKHKFQNVTKAMLKEENFTDQFKLALDRARLEATYNYRYVTPYWYKGTETEPASIQFLMPLFLDRTKKSPSCLLVLRRCKKKKQYEPKTVLTLAEGYNNARLIAPLENPWFNAKNIVVRDFDDLF